MTTISRKDVPERYRAEYIWVDGAKPTPGLRSKTKILEIGQEPEMWGFDGSSTLQAPGNLSDCVLRPVKIVPDPVRGGDDLLVLCEVLNTDLSPHTTNSRAACAAIEEKYASFEPLFGLEQEYTLLKQNGRPLGFPEEGEPAPQGPYYCAVGTKNIFGRNLAEDHMEACLEAGLAFCGINAEVMPGQWEFQVGVAGPLEMADDIIIARWLLERIAEEYGVVVSYDGKPVAGDWNGAGAHANFSTNQMRESYDACIAAAEALGTKADEHIKNYGHGIEERLTGLHETCSYKEFKYGVSDRGASVRIPWHVEKAKKGYIEDRRPNANCDPYVVARMMVDTICGASLGKKLENSTKKSPLSGSLSM